MRIPQLAAIVCFALNTPAFASDRFYPDSFAISQNGRYRIDATSPDNARQHPRPFASNFTYTLTDTTTKAVIWKRKQPMTRSKGSSYASAAEPSPVAVFVTDEGLVAALSCADSLIFLDPRHGKKRAEAQVLQAFPSEQQDKFVMHTTAGSIWSQDSDWFFLRVPDAKAPMVFFVVRPFWHHRLIIDASTGKHIDLGTYNNAASIEALAGADDRIRSLLTATIDEETRRAMTGLAGAPKRLEDDNDHRAHWQTRSALHTVAFLKLDQAEPQLRVLESRLDHGKHTHTQLQAKIRQTLRSLGKVPEPGCGVRLYPLVNRGTFATHDTDRPFTASVPASARLANAPRIAAGMSIKDLTDMIGCPDARLFDGGSCYDYDIDASPSYTLRVFLTQDESSVTTIRTITPFAFLHDPHRMREY
jgi:hypothetical protein